MALRCTQPECANPVLVKKRGLCVKHYAMFRKYGTADDRALTCAHCGVGFESVRKKKYCSKECMYRSIKNSVPMDEYKRKMKASRKPQDVFVCACCHQESYRRLSQTNIKNGYQNRYCGMSCQVDMNARLRVEIDGLRRIAKANKTIAPSEPRATAPKSRHSLLKSLVVRLRKVEAGKAKEDRANRPCMECGEPVGGTHGRRMFCSKGCLSSANKKREKTEATKQSLKASKLRRKAMERGAMRGVSIKPFDVFKRDGWVCQMCGTDTPVEMRGSYADNAPEVDHIIPVSKGGWHVMDNLQTACRACNAWKSDRIIERRQGAFTGLIGAS
jgi:hypothetical protein